MSSKNSGERAEKLPHAYDFQVVEPSAQISVKEAITSVLGNEVYSAAQAQKQVDTINRTIVSKLNQLTGNFKWVVTTLICAMAETGASGLQVDNSLMWNPDTDGCFVIEWQNKSIQATVCVYGLAL